MSQFIESIAIRKGEASLLDLHQERINRTFLAFYPGLKPHKLANILAFEPSSQLIKCRMVYDAKSYKIEYKPYFLPNIESLQITKNEQVDYAFKSFDRSELKDLFSKRKLCDDIIIVKNGLITDAYFANIALFDGNNWYTPDQPLLAGVRREYLLRMDQLVPLKINIGDLQHFKKISLINAMIDLGELVIPVEQVFY